jgi:cytochrome c556
MEQTMRYVALFLLGLFIGAALAVIAVNRIHEGQAYPHGVMTVMRAQMGALDRSVKQNRCTAADLLPRFQTLRAVSNDIEPAFGEDDERFIKHASAMRAAADAAIATPPGNCQAAAATLDRLSAACSACHKDFKD